MELSSDIQSVLKTIKGLKDKYDIQQYPRDSVGNNGSFQADYDFQNDIEQDIIDVDGMDLSDDETWLCTNLDSSNSSKVTDIYKWLRQDLEDVKGNEYKIKKLLLEQEMGNLDRKLKANIDSRTFTRPKKKCNRPGLEHVIDRLNPSYDYLNTSNNFDSQDSVTRHKSYANTFDASFSEDDDLIYGRLSFSSKMNKNPTEKKSGKFKLFDSVDPDLDLKSNNETVSQIMGNFRNVLNTSQKGKNEDISVSRYTLPSSLQDVIREQTLELESSKQQKFIPHEFALLAKLKELDKSTNKLRNNTKESIPTERELHFLRQSADGSEKCFRNPFDNMETSNDSFQNMSPPSLVSSFASVNFSSLTESDFITAMNQPQDLYTSFTSTVASDIGEDHASLGSENEMFAHNVKEMHEMFTKDIQCDGSLESTDEMLNTTVIETSLDDNKKCSDNLDITYTGVEPEKTFCLPQLNYFSRSNNFINKDSGPESLNITFEPDKNKMCFNTYKKSKSAKSTVLGNISTEQENVMNPENNIKDVAYSANITYQKVKTSDNSNLIKMSESPGILDKTFTKPCDLNNTSTKVPSFESSIEEIPQIECGLNENDTAEKKCNILEKSIKPEFEQGSTDSLDRTSSTSDSSYTTARIMNMKELDQLVRMQEQSLQPVVSTPIPNRTFCKAAWGSSEALVPVKPPSMDGYPSDESDASFENNRDIKKGLSSTHSSPGRRILYETKTMPIFKATSTPRLYDQKLSQPKVICQELSKPEVRPPKAQLRPTMIVKPMESHHSETIQKQVPVSVPQNVASDTVIQQPRVSMLRQPVSRSSGLPRPVGSGIPRPASRLPGPRTLKPPSSGLQRPSVAKNNWMDGCY